MLAVTNANKKRHPCANIAQRVVAKRLFTLKETRSVQKKENGPQNKLRHHFAPVAPEVNVPVGRINNIVLMDIHVHV